MKHDDTYRNGRCLWGGGGSTSIPRHRGARLLDSRVTGHGLTWGRPPGVSLLSRPWLEREDKGVRKGVTKLHTKQSRQWWWDLEGAEIRDFR